MKIEWIDGGREPRSPPNLRFPKGIDVDMSNGSSMACLTTVPYPAKRCGTYVIECEACGLRVAVTTAGRPDDPRTVKLACIRGTRQ